MKRFLLLLSALCLTAVPVRAQSTQTPQFRQIRVIERESGHLPVGSLEAFSFDSTGALFAAAASETMVNVWNVDTGEVVHSLADDSVSVSWSPDNRLIGTGNGDELRIWDAATGTVRYELAEDGRNIAWSPDSKRFLTTGLNIFDARTGNKQIHIETVSGYAMHVYWSPDGEKLASTDGWDSSYINIWSADGAFLDIFWGDSTASWSPDSTRLASSRQVRELSTGLPVAIIPGMFGIIAWHPYEEWIASTRWSDANETSELKLWSALDGSLQASWTISGCHIDGFAWASTGRRFALGCVRPNSDQLGSLLIWEQVA